MVQVFWGLGSREPVGGREAANLLAGERSWFRNCEVWAVANLLVGERFKGASCRAEMMRK